jgi:DNA repair protein RadC
LFYQQHGWTEPNAKPTYRIADLKEADCLPERLETLGPQALTNAELIAILLRVGVRGENVVEVGKGCSHINSLTIKKRL